MASSEQKPKELEAFSKRENASKPVWADTPSMKECGWNQEQGDSCLPVWSWNAMMEQSRHALWACLVQIAYFEGHLPAGVTITQI